MTRVASRRLRPAPVPVAARWTGTRRFLKAQFAATVATSADWAVITVTVLIHGHYLLAVFLGSLTGACFDFGIKRRWVFDARGGSPTVQVGRYGAVSLISLALNESLSWVAVGLLHQPKVLGPLVVSIVVGTLWNYPLQRRFVFHHTTRPAALREGAL